MSRAAAVTDPSLALAWSVGARPLAGYDVSGDTHVVVPIADGFVVAAVDGLGHGEEAAEAAAVAAATIADHAEEPVMRVIQKCHDAMRKTRGAAISIARFDTGFDTMTWIGVGNVEGVLRRAAPDAEPPHETLLLRGGVVGYQLPPLRSSTLALFPGDTLVFATDGVSGAFRQEALSSLHEVDAAWDILVRHAKDNDDALILVARYQGRIQ